MSETDQRRVSDRAWAALEECRRRRWQPVRWSFHPEIYTPLSLERNSYGMYLVSFALDEEALPILFGIPIEQSLAGVSALECVETVFRSQEHRDILFTFTEQGLEIAE